MSQPTVFVFANGNVAVTDTNGEQIPELQKSVVALICERMEAHHYYPADFVFLLPAGKAKVFKTESGWNWEMINDR